MNTIVTDPDTIGRLVQEAVDRAVGHALPELVRRATQKQVLTKDELKKETGWSDRRIQYLRDSRQLPFIQHGRSFLYPRDGLQNFYAQNRINALRSEN